MDPLPPGLPPHEQLGILAGAFQHDVANHASVLSGLVQLLETTPPPGRDGARLFAELQRALGRFNEALAEFTRMRRALTQPTPRCAPAEVAAAIRTAPGGGTLAATVAPDDPALSGDARWFAFLVATLGWDRWPAAEADCLHGARAEPPACAELRLQFGKLDREPLAAFVSRVPPTPLSPELAVARITLLRLDGTAELVSGEAGLLLRLRSAIRGPCRADTIRAQPTALPPVLCIDFATHHDLLFPPPVCRGALRGRRVFPPARDRPRADARQVLPRRLRHVHAQLSAAVRPLRRQELVRLLHLR